VLFGKKKANSQKSYGNNNNHEEEREFGKDSERGKSKNTRRKSLTRA